MSNINKMAKTDINSYLPEKYSFICFSSFEKRSTTVSSCIDCNSVIKAYVLRNCSSDAIDDNALNFNYICQKFATNSIPLEVNLCEPLHIADTSISIIKNLIEEKTRNIVIDITTFTHEALLILIRVIYDNRQYFDDIICLYNGATNYGGETDPGKIWLSKGCHDVRNVIGYPGKLKPSLKTHLTILSGYERERATRLIDLLEPDILSLAVGDDNEPTETENKDMMMHFNQYFSSWTENLRLDVDCFAFSCSDVEKTFKILIERFKKAPNENHIVVPLNTKLSTIATAIAALSVQDVQVCYSLPEIYNTDHYSEPSDNITIINLNKFPLFAQ